ncbi:FAD-binding oxidoreductase [Jatrophihabitans lederbergiae]|uniref:FAD-binding oxidoreductase n=1 Tax=Jatrophihabitans lederbergiae TaxID=3075547 RepID=A0ABU2J7A8_9ACTN|nr:FAD-binding oxidoreductase [Jatrophihabitans sp. DSM 44399]MDT0260875.1 FAD-binding oxidoreductase [Jatrophihabitans sp. DSM 44399]
MDRRSFLATGVALSAGAVVTAAGASPSGGDLAAAHGRRRRLPWDQLRRHLTGRLVLPSDEAYEQAHRLAAAQFDSIFPQAVALCATERDVATCIAFAQQHSLPSAVRSGGHSFAGFSTSEGLVIDLSGFRQVTVGSSSVHVGPAAQMVDVVTALSPHGLAVPGGFCPTVCPGGFISGGGMGWMYRKYGPACDRVLSARVVLANGHTVTASPRQNPDLYWAIRGGGGGNFGVIVDYELAPTTETRVGYFTLTWPWAQADHVLTQLQEWFTNTSPDLAPRAGILLSNAAPGAVPTVIVTGVHFGSRATLDADLAELVSMIGSAPATRVVDELSYQQASMRQFGCQNDSVEQCHLSGANPEALLPRQQFVLNRSRMHDKAISDSGFDGILTAFDADRRAGQYRYLGLLSLGKNANRPAPGDTAYVHRRSSLFSVFTAGLSSATPSSDDRAAAVDWARGGFRAIDAHSNGHTYVNYPDTELANWEWAYYGTNYPRLLEVKHAYDPHRFFRFSQSVGGR